jgi:hypothetical protein
MECIVVLAVFKTRLAGTDPRIKSGDGHGV